MGIDNFILYDIIEAMKKLLEEELEDLKTTTKKAKIVRTSKGVDCMLTRNRASHKIEAFIQKRGDVLLVGELILGYDDEDENSIRLSIVNVAKEFRNLGIGSVMVYNFVEFARNRGYAKIKIDSFSSATEFLKKCGFETVGPTRGIVEMEMPLNHNYNY